MDCCEGKNIPYMEIGSFMNGQEVVEQLQERMTGRFIAETIVDPDTGEEIIHENCMVTPKRAAKIMSEGVDAEGKPFDPDYHNAVTHVEDENYGENVVAEEMQKGYMYKDQVLRYSMVKVAN